MVSIADQPNSLSKSMDVSLKFLGDFAVLPGASQFMNGKMGSGVGHVAAGVAGGVLLGPVGWLAVAANSFTKSLTNESVWDQVTESDEEEKAREAKETKARLDEIAAVVNATLDAREKASKKEEVCATEG